MDGMTRQLVDFALATKFDSLAPAAVHECKRRLIDSFACALGAFDVPLCADMRHLASEYGGPARATVWGTRTSTSSEMAAFANGVMLRVHDFNDTFFAKDGAHPSDIVAGIVAAAESAGATGQDLITATVVGYEVYCRFMESVDVGSSGYDQTVYAVVAEAVACGKLMGLPADRLGHAVSLALTPNLALRQTRHGQLSVWKGCAAANASRNALFAVGLAARGVSGPSDVFEGKQGLWAAVGRFDWADASQWPQAHMVGATYLKNYAVCYHAQSAAQAAIELHPAVKPGDIVSIEVGTYADAVKMIGSDPSRWAPRTRETADHSLPFIVATCLFHGAVSADSFDESRLEEAGVTRLMDVCKVVESTEATGQYPHAAPATVTVRTASGGIHAAHVLYPKGHSGAPMQDSEVEAKFRTLCGPAGGTQAFDDALAALWRIESARDIGAEVLTPLAMLQSRR